MFGLLASVYPYALVSGWLFFSGWASGHAILSKRDSRAAVSWTGLIWLVPYLGAVFYFLLGINRVQRRANRLRSRTTRHGRSKRGGHPVESALAPELPAEAAQLAALVELVTLRPLLGRNCIEPLENGDEAYPAMLESIASAERSVWLLSYIFDDSPVARSFVSALGQAKARGVEVRVLIDDAGSLDTNIDSLFEAVGVAVERFLPARLSRRLAHFNLRNHRKLLIIDGATGFTGGINVHEGHLLSSKPRWPVRDVHFRLEGPIVAQLVEVFADDWEFTTGEALIGERAMALASPAGEVAARGIPDGPDDGHHGGVRLTLLGALSCARRSVTIVTPYFLPDQAVISAIVVAGLRGVSIDIVLPRRSDVRIVDFATRAQLWQVQSPGIRVWMSPEPFDHSKLMVMDDYWSFIGSANWDARSFRLNFEFNVECYERKLAARLVQIAKQRIAESHQVTLAELDARPLGERLRDGLCRLMTPYL